MTGGGNGSAWGNARERERRGDLVAAWSEDLLHVLELGAELIPGAAYEIPRDLFGLLGYVWAAREKPDEIYSPHAVLREVRERAWLGYADMPALIDLIRRDLPRAETGARMVAFFEELAKARSTYLFLPVVARIDAHQGGGAALGLGSLRLDDLADRWRQSGAAQLAAAAFAAAPEATRERDAFLLALATAGWGKGARRMDNAKLLREVAAQLRALHAGERTALTSIRADMSARGPDGARARELVAIAEEVSERAPWVWLEALFIVENWITGPKFFRHAFEARSLSAPC